MLGIHWLTREVEEVAAYQGRFAWDPNLTYQGFYDGFAERCYGKPWAAQMSKIHRELESLGPRWTGAFADSDIRPVTWAAKDHTIKPENRTKLAEIRQQLVTIREQMIAQKRREGLERVEWLITTIDWLIRYDDACLKLALDGAFGTLLADAEAAHKKGDLATAKKKAETARDMLLQSGMREAIQTYPQKMSVDERFRCVCVDPNQGLRPVSDAMGASEEDFGTGFRRHGRTGTAQRRPAAAGGQDARHGNRSVARSPGQRRGVERQVRSRPAR